LSCYSNNLIELNLSNNQVLAYDHIRAEGNGFIGCYYYDYDINLMYVGYRCLYAHPVYGASFEGFYDETGALISEGEWSDYYEAYIYEFEGYPTGTIIARFSGGFTAGDIDGDGTVSMNDALTTMRISMGAMDGSSLNTDAADMDGNGSISLADAILILRTAMGLS